MSVRNDLLDIMGVSQHHDAITGTAKQHVANDYAYNLYKSVHNNTHVYSLMIKELAMKTANIDAVKWEQCYRTNSTWLDCPMARHDGGNVTFIAAIHNPQLDYSLYQSFKVSHDKFTAYYWDDVNDKWGLLN